MNKKMKKLSERVTNKLNFRKNYIIANVIKRKQIDNENDCFNIMSDENLVDEIVNNKKSLARFGDGELSLMLEEKFEITFQKNSKELTEKLYEVLNSNIDNLIIGISVSFSNPSRYNKKTIRYCRTFNYLYRNKLKEIIPQNKVYGNASITRFYIDYEKKNLENAYERVNNLKRIWNERNLLIVEGIHTRLGVGNDLFSNSNRIRRITVPEANAFYKYDEIVKAIEDNVMENEMVLLAIGPTATVCAYELAKKNIQALDVGHIDIEYEWLLRKVKKRVPIKGKYVNEIRGIKYLENNNLYTEYENSIICNIE